MWLHDRDFYSNVFLNALLTNNFTNYLVLSKHNNVFPFSTAIYKAAFLLHFHILTGLCFSSAGFLLHVFVFVLSLGNCGFLEWGVPACKCQFVNTIMRQWRTEFLVKQLSSVNQSMKRKPYFYLNCKKRGWLTSQSTRGQITQCNGSKHTHSKRQLHLLVQGKKSASMPRVNFSSYSVTWMVDNQ